MAARIPLLASLLLLLGACQNEGYTDTSRTFAEPVQSDREFPEVIHEPTSFGVLDAPLISDAKREIPAGTACVTCHGVNPDKDWTANPGDRFHTNVEIEHGNLQCNQCHSDDRTVLHLADNTPIPFVDVMRLCSQCHGPQYANYQHGAHGGKNGYWDRRQGPQIRNNCVDCHTPHSPKFKQVMPVLPPRDRYLGSE